MDKFIGVQTLYVMDTLVCIPVFYAKKRVKNAGWF